MEDDIEVGFTHYAWLGICPLYLAETEDEVIVEVRHWLFVPLWYLCIAAHVIFSLPMTIVRGGIQESVPFLITGEIE